VVMEKRIWKGIKREMRGTRKWDDVRLVPINLRANGIMKHRMKERTSVLQSTTLRKAIWLKGISLLHSTSWMEELI